MENDAPRNEESVNLEEIKKKRTALNILINSLSTKKAFYSFLLVSISVTFLFVGVRYLQIATGNAISFLPRKASNSPSINPTALPSISNNPTSLPSSITFLGTSGPSQNPTLNSTDNPSFLPTNRPSRVLSSKPTSYPSSNPSVAIANITLSPN